MDVNVAVATDNGLITPIVFGADTKVSLGFHQPFDKRFFPFFFCV